MKCNKCGFDKEVFDKGLTRLVGDVGFAFIVVFLVMAFLLFIK